MSGQAAIACQGEVRRRKSKPKKRTGDRRTDYEPSIHTHTGLTPTISATEEDYTASQGTENLIDKSSPCSSAP
jgi:hypothetical protein